jgi:hypothetical protein
MAMTSVEVEEGGARLIDDDDDDDTDDPDAVADGDPRVDRFGDEKER